MGNIRDLLVVEQSHQGSLGRRIVSRLGLEIAHRLEKIFGVLPGEPRYPTVAAKCTEMTCDALSGCNDAQGGIATLFVGSIVDLWPRLLRKVLCDKLHLILFQHRRERLHNRLLAQA